MSNDIPSRDEIAEQAGSSSGDGSEERRREQLLRENRAKLRANMTIQEKKDYFDKLAKDFKTYFSNDEVGVDIMLSYEEGGFLPNPDLKKHFLKGKLENNPFKTQEWRTWVSKRSIDFSHCG